MNIFEAMEINGRAVLPDRLKFVYRDRDNNFCWYLYTDKGMKVLDKDLCRNDWMPDVPRETMFEKERYMRECAIYNKARDNLLDNGISIDVIDRILIKPEFKPEKIKRTVTTRVKWKKLAGQTIIYPHFLDLTPYYDNFPNKPEMKMTLEWEEQE